MRISDWSSDVCSSDLIGLLKALEEEGVRVEAISGVSAGSIIGALSANGNTAGEILEIVQETDMFKIIRKGVFPLMTGAFSSLGHLEHPLMRFLPENSLEALEKSFFVTAVNLNAGKAEVLDRKSVV